jgi:outer membrane protein
MKKLITICFAALVSLGYSQDSTLSVLTFQEAIKIGLEKNVALNTQKNTLYSSQARRLQGMAGYLPFINAQGVGQRANGLQIDPTTGQGANVSSDQVFGQISANYILFNGFNRISTLKQNNNAFFAQDALVKRSKQDLVSVVTTQYLQVLLDQELLRIAQENLNAQQANLDQIKGFVEVGSRPAADEYTQDALVQNFKVTFLRAKMTLENDRALLAQTLQLDPSQQFRVQQPTWENNISYFKGLSLDSLFQIALQNREDLKQQNYLVEASQHTVRASTSTYYPTISLFSNYGSTYYASNAWQILNQPERKPASFNTQFKTLNPSLNYGLQLTIPIFDRLVTRTNRVLAKVTRENAKLTRDNLAKSIKIDVQRSFKNYETAIESYDASLVQYKAAELALRTQQESYNLGITSQVALAQATQTFVQGASSKAQAEVTLVFQQMLLEYAMGTLKVEAILEP